MTRNLLQICAEALEGTGIPDPSAIVAGDELGAEMYRLAHTVGEDIVDRGDWQALYTEASFTTTAVALQCTLASIGTDIRRIVDKTFWNRTRQQRVYGPVSPQAWQRIQATAATPSRQYYRIRGGNIYFTGTLTASESCYFEYITNNWVSNAAGNSFARTFSADTDIPRFDDYALVLGLRWRFREAKGIEYAEAMKDFELYIARRLGDDKPAETLSMVPGERDDGDYMNWSVPEGNWYQ